MLGAHSATTPWAPIDRCRHSAGSAHGVNIKNSNRLLSYQEEPRIFVESEDQPNRVLLETKITKDDGYQKQQGLCPASDFWSNKRLLMTVLRDRNLDRLDRTEWHGYGAEFPGGRRLRGDLVRRLVHEPAWPHSVSN